MFEKLTHTHACIQTYTKYAFLSILNINTIMQSTKARQYPYVHMEKVNTIIARRKIIELFAAHEQQVFTGKLRSKEFYEIGMRQMNQTQAV